jgi:hypothetical protein
MSEHCGGTACLDTTIERTRNGSDAPVCECDCENCAEDRRPPGDVLADAYSALRELHNDFGDEGGLFHELTETLAALLREQEADEIDQYEASHGKKARL